MKITKSIFTKLFITIIIVGIVVNLLVGAFFRYLFMPRNRPVLLNNIKQYTDYIVKDIGNPPDIKRAALIAKETGFDISIEGNGVSWSSTGRPPLAGVPHELHMIGDGSITWERGRFLYIKESRYYRYFFSTMSLNPTEGKDLHLITLIIILSLILGVCFLLIRKILMPVRNLTAGIREVSSGNLEYIVESSSGDELGELTRSFNEMRERIGLMLRSREQLLLDVSHELRSPLTRMKLALEYLDDSSAKRDIAEDILEMEAMVTEILQTERLNSRDGKPRLEQAMLSEIVNEVVEGLHIKPGEIQVSSYGDTGIRTDRNLMKTVFKNLIENARKYTEPGKPPVTVALREQDGMVLAEVRDFGIGIPANELPFVFEPFYRVDHSRSRRTGGYGLGLSLCKKIIEAHGGTIEIESTPGEGTAVRVKLKKPGAG